MMMMMVCVLYEAEKSPTTCGCSVGKTNSNSVDYGQALNLIEISIPKNPQANVCVILLPHLS